MRYLSVCSGIEAATVAWEPLGWEPVAFAEIEPFPVAVLAHHYPDVPNVGDFTKIRGDEYGPIDLLVGGTPCQAFSVAGQRGGFSDDRGNLTLEFIRLLGRARPRWFVWENVPGVLSLDGGRTFGVILGQMAKLGYGLAYRICDAQFFGVPQRRRRVFVAGYLGDWRCAAAVLFERQGGGGHPAPGREARQEVTGTLTGSIGKHGGGSNLDVNSGHIIPTVCSGPPFSRTGNSRVESEALIVSKTLLSRNSRIDYETETLVVGCVETHNNRWKPEKLVLANTLRGEGFDGSEDGTGRQNGVALSPRQGARKLTPREAERLQGFTDDYTLIPYKGKPAADGPRYKAIGNSMAVPVMRWIGTRIDQFENGLLEIPEAEPQDDFRGLPLFEFGLTEERPEV